MKCLILIAFIMLSAVTEEIYTTKSRENQEHRLYINLIKSSLNYYGNLMTPQEPYIYVWPVVTEDYKKLSSFYGYRNNPLRENIGSIDMKDHYAVDITGVKGARVKNLDWGTVTDKWYEEGYHFVGGEWRWFSGHEDFNGCVIVEYDNEWKALHGHVFEIAVHEGDRVEPGQIIARINPEKDDKSTGPHLHFALWNKEGNPVQPLNYIKEPE